MFNRTLYFSRYPSRLIFSGFTHDLPSPLENSQAPELRATASPAKHAPFWLRASANETLKRTPILSGMTVMHLGCGNGFLLERLGSYTGVHLFGVDSVPEALAAARTTLPSSVTLDYGFHEHIPHIDNRFDVVILCDTLHKTQSHAAVLREVFRVLKPGGRVVITDWCDDYLGCLVCDHYLRITRNKNHGRTYSQKGITELLASSGFNQPTSEHYEIKWSLGLFTAQAQKPA